MSRGFNLTIIAASFLLIALVFSGKVFAIESVYNRDGNRIWIGKEGEFKFPEESAVYYPKKFLMGVMVVTTDGVACVTGELGESFSCMDNTGKVIWQVTKQGAGWIEKSYNKTGEWTTVAVEDVSAWLNGAGEEYTGFLYDAGNIAADGATGVADAIETVFHGTDDIVSDYGGDIFVNVVGSITGAVSNTVGDFLKIKLW